MKEEKKILSASNQLLADERIVVNQYLVYPELREYLGYKNLHMDFRIQTIDEMHHGKLLIEQIINFEGRILTMLYTIAVVLVIMWLMGLVTSYTMGGFIHILLVIAIVVVLVNIISGRKPV